MLSIPKTPKPQNPKTPKPQIRTYLMESSPQNPEIKRISDLAVNEEEDLIMAEEPSNNPNAGLLNNEEMDSPALDSRMSLDNIDSDFPKKAQLEEHKEPSSFSLQESKKIRQLYFGDKIKLYYQGDTKFYLTTDGIATNRVFFQKMTSSEINKGSNGDVFIIVPTSENKMFKSILADIKALKPDIRKDRQEVLQDNEDAYMDEIPIEIRNNYRVHFSSKKTPIRYNSMIQLVHERTMQLLKISSKVDLSSAVQTGFRGGKSRKKIEARVESDLMRVYSLKLSSSAVEETNFMFAPCFKYQDGLPVLTQDNFYLAFKDPQLLNKSFSLSFNPIYNHHSQKIFNCYLTEETKSPIYVELYDDSYLESHNYKYLHSQAIYITHIHTNMYLRLKLIEKATDQDENELADFILPEDEATTQAFSLSLKEYDPSRPIPSDGLWLGFASPTDKTEVHYRHLIYSVWLQPMKLEQIIRAEGEEGKIVDGSLFKLYITSMNTYLEMKGKAPARRHTMINTPKLSDKRISNFLLRDEVESYYRSFKASVPPKHDQLVLLILSDLAKYIRMFDLETAKRLSDFTEESMLKILSRALKKIKLLCLNGFPLTLEDSLPYKMPNEVIQRYMREMWCIDSAAFLLLKLFPGGASMDYTENPLSMKLLGQLLKQITIAVKNNKENKMYTFRRSMRTIQKYIGLHLHKNQEDKALLSVVENCEEILLDSSLEHIINQFVRELSSNTFFARMKKSDILKILSIFCVNEEKGINGIQNLLHNILFETEIGTKVLLLFKFSSVHDNQLFLKIDGDVEINCCGEWEASEEKTCILKYFKNQLFLFADMIHQNDTNLNIISKLFPLEALLTNLRSSEVAIEARVGLTRIFTSIFMNTEKVMMVKKPKTQRIWTDDIKQEWKQPKYLDNEQLRSIKKLINDYFSEGTDMDNELSYEFMKLLSYMLNSDFIIGSVSSKEEWEEQLSETYNLLSNVFKFSINLLIRDTKDVTYFRKRTTTSNLSQISDEIEEVSLMHKTQEKISEAELDKVPMYLKYPLQYLYIFSSKMSGSRDTDIYQSYNKDINVLLKEEICKFLTQVMHFAHDGYISSFTECFFNILDDDIEDVSEKCVCFLHQVFRNGKIGKEEKLLTEVDSAMKYLDIQQLYRSSIITDYTDEESKETFLTLLINVFITAKDERLEAYVLEVLIGSQFKHSEFAESLDKLYLIMNKDCLIKREQLFNIIPKLTDLINHSTNCLNVSDIKNLKQVSTILANLQLVLSQLYSMFWFERPNEEEEEKSKSETEMKAIDSLEVDVNFAKLFLQTKSYLIILDFLRSCKEEKLEAAKNVLEGNENLGLHAVTVSSDLLKVIDLCNYILIALCKGTSKAKTQLLKHIPKICMVPPPSDIQNKTKWSIFTKMSETDVDLIFNICQGNNQIAFLNNKQVGYFTTLVKKLNLALCPLNIHKIFTVFESIMDQTTHEGLYKDILGYFWDKKKLIVLESALELNSNSTKEDASKLVVLLRVSCLLARGSDLKKAKHRLKDLFELPLLVPIIEKITTLFRETEKVYFLNIIRPLIEVYTELYLQDPPPRDQEYLEFQKVFDRLEEIMKDKTELCEEEIDMLDTFIKSQRIYRRWAKSNLQTNSLRRMGTFSQTVLYTLSEVARRLPPSDKKAKAIESILNFVEDVETPQESKEVKNILYSKSSTRIPESNDLSEFKYAKRKMLEDPRVKVFVEKEFNHFCQKLLNFIKLSEPKDIQERAIQQNGRLFLGKLVEYIGKCGKPNNRVKTVKYLILSLNEVLKIAGKDQETEKGRKKGRKQAILMLDELKLTKTLLTLLCSDESESLDAILPALLQLANSILHSRIKKIQDQFYKEFSTNKKSEKLFERISTSINRNIFIHFWHPQMFAMPKRNRIFQAISQIDMQKEILVFLRLLCEKQHEELQNFLVHHRDYKKNYNMIHLLVKYLNTLVSEIKYLNQEQFENPKSQRYSNNKERKALSYEHSILTIAALSESLQGPQKANQESLCNTEFLAIAHDIMFFDFLFLKDPHQETGNCLSNYELCCIKEKCALLLLCLLEQRSEGDAIVTKMKANIKELTLMKNLKYVYYAFTREKNMNYTDELLFQEFEEAVTVRTDSFHLSLGFTVLFVLKKWFELSPELNTKAKATLSTISSKVTKKAMESSGFFKGFITFWFDLVTGFVGFFSKAITRPTLRMDEYERLCKDDSFYNEALCFFDKYTGTVEIVRKKNSEIVHFPILSYAEAINSTQQREAMEGIPIGQAKGKLDYFMRSCLGILQTMKNEYLFTKTFKNYPVIGAIAKHVSLWDSLAFYVAILLNVVVMLSYRKEDKGFTDHLKHPKLLEYYSEETTQLIISSLGMMLCIFASIMVISYLFKFIPAVYGKAKQEFDFAIESVSSPMEVMKFRMQFIFNLAWLIGTNVNLYFNLIYFTLNLCGLLMHPLFYTYHLMMVVVRYQKLVEILQAFWGPINEIILTLVLFVIIQYVFAVLGYYFFPTDFPGFTSYSMLSTFIYIFDVTFKADGGLGSALSQVFKTNEETEEVSFDIGRLLYDQMFNFILLILLVQILSGLIIDKFGEIRESGERKEEELKNTCIMCGKKGDIIERNTGKNFEYHKENIHNIWHYLLFIGYLRRKPKRELNGIEAYVNKSFTKEDISWLPFSLWESKDEVNRREQFTKQLKEIENKIQSNSSG